jgi:uncharacterized protein YhhL (DUF1145 family)
MAWMVSTLSLVSPFAGNLDKPGRYLEWGPIQISVGNLVMIGVIVVLFVLAIVLPFPKGRRRP